jgi:hypothetical protein
MATEYDLSVVRQLLVEAFNIGELDTMAFTLFPDLHRELNPMLNLSKKVEAIVDHAARRELVEEVLGYVQQYNGRRYELFAARLVKKEGELGGERPNVERLKRERERVQVQYDLLAEKARRLGTALAIETDVTRKFQMEKQLEEVEGELKVVSGQLDEIDGVLG